jgi:hypothetical protein
LIQKYDEARHQGSDSAGTADNHLLPVDENVVSRVWIGVTHPYFL